MTLHSKEFLYRELEAHKNFEASPENAEIFLNTADRIALEEDSSCISKLISYFDDTTEYDWVYQSLIHVIEHFDDEIYVLEVLKHLSFFIKNSPIWASEIFNRIFNSPSCLKIFQKNLHFASHESLLKLFDIMDVESPHHHELIAELRAQVLTEKPQV